MKSNPEVLEWDVVNESHKTQRAVYHVGGSIHSLLCTDNAGNIYSDNEIFFRLPKSPQYSSDFRSMQNSFSIDKSFRIFKKLAINKWIYLGRGSITKIDSSQTNVHIFHISLLI